MTDFNAQRFLAVARWDLTLNACFYLRFALVVCALMALPTLTSICGLCAERYCDSWDVAEVAFNMLSLYLLLFPWLFGWMLHTMATRTGRACELTLPATALEKFLWHVCLVALGSLAVAVACFAVMDILHTLAYFALVEHSLGGELVSALCKARDLYPASPLRPGLLFSLFFASLFALGNAWKYKHNLGLTFLCLVALLFVATIALTTIAALTFTGRDISVLFLSFRAMKAGALAVLLAVAVLAWVFAFRLYSRASLTSRRNP